jgi:hypothetical protein
MLKLWPSGVPTADAFVVAHRVDKARRARLEGWIAIGVVDWRVR